MMKRVPFILQSLTLALLLTQSMVQASLESNWVELYAKPLYDNKKTTILVASAALASCACYCYIRQELQKTEKKNQTEHTKEPSNFSLDSTTLSKTTATQSPVPETVLNSVDSQKIQKPITPPTQITPSVLPLVTNPFIPTPIAPITGLAEVKIRHEETAHTPLSKATLTDQKDLKGAQENAHKRTVQFTWNITEEQLLFKDEPTDEGIAPEEFKIFIKGAGNEFQELTRQNPVEIEIENNTFTIRRTCTFVQGLKVEGHREFVFTIQDPNQKQLTLEYDWQTKEEIDAQDEEDHNRTTKIPLQFIIHGTQYSGKGSFHEPGRKLLEQWKKTKASFAAITNSFASIFSFNKK